MLEGIFNNQIDEWREIEVKVNKSSQFYDIEYVKPLKTIDFNNDDNYIYCIHNYI